MRGKNCVSLYWGCNIQILPRAHKCPVPPLHKVAGHSICCGLHNILSCEFYVTGCQKVMVNRFVNCRI
jgi:hypothetical protein